VLDLMTSMSDTILQKAEVRISDFNLAIQTTTVKFGACWEDVVIHLEWKDDYTAILDSSKFSDEVKSAVRSSMESSKQYGQFNEATVSRWVANGKGGSFSDHIVEELPAYRKDIINERYN